MIRHPRNPTPGCRAACLSQIRAGVHAAAAWERRDWDEHRRWVDEIARLRIITARECFGAAP